MMQPKFNFYDFLGYLIPGAFILTLFFWLYTAFFSLSSSIEIKSIGESMLFIVVSYTLGHLVQTLGNVIERREVIEWGGWFSDQFLREDNGYYTLEFKTKLKDGVKKIFDLSSDTSLVEENAKKNRRQEIFNLCYSLIVQENSAQHTEIFNGIYSLYRGLLVVNFSAMIASLLVTLKHLLWLIFIMLNINPPIGAFWVFESFHLGLGIIVLLLCYFSIRPLKSRYKRFAQLFADSVYTNFYVWYKRRPVEKKSK